MVRFRNLGSVEARGNSEISKENEQFQKRRKQSETLEGSSCLALILFKRGLHSRGARPGVLSCVRPQYHIPTGLGDGACGVYVGLGSAHTKG